MNQRPLRDRENDGKAEPASSQPPSRTGGESGLIGPTFCAGDLVIFRPKLAQDRIENPLLVRAQITSRLFADHPELIDECPGERGVRRRRLRRRIWMPSERKKGLLMLHHHELDEKAGHLTGFGRFLNFGHALSLHGFRRDPPASQFLRRLDHKCFEPEPGPFTLRAGE